MRVAKPAKFLLPSGMLGVVFYFAHIIIGELLWKTYNPITTDISSLTADGAPNAGLLRVFTLLYGICTVLFAAGMVTKAFHKFHTLLRIGFLVFLVMELFSAVGYNLFPLTGDETQMNMQNTMHIVVTAVVVITTIASAFLIGLGYLRQEKKKRTGVFVLIMAVLITVFGSLNSLGMAWHMLGLTERLCIYSLQIMTFGLSLINTLTIKSEAFNKIRLRSGNGGSKPAQAGHTK
jgi:hypothetical protein